MHRVGGCPSVLGTTPIQIGICTPIWPPPRVELEWHSNYFGFFPNTAKQLLGRKNKPDWKFHSNLASTWSGAGVALQLFRISPTLLPIHVFDDEVPLMSPTELAPLSSWLEKVRLESRLRSDEWPPSDVRIDRDDVEVEAGENESGWKP